jgi:hypothetical protein
LTPVCQQNGQLVFQAGPDQYTITVAGKEFLKWMAENGLTEEKPF